MAQTEEMKAAFKLFDTDGSGAIDQDELYNALKALGVKMVKKEVKALLKDLDKDGSGAIDFEEFKRLMNDKWVNIEINQEDEFWRAFWLFDRWDEGKITSSDLRITADELYDPTDE